MIGPAIGGFLGEYGLRLPFYAAAALAFANALYGVFVLPESLRPEDRRPITWARANPFGLLGRVWRDPKLRSMAFAWSCSWIGLGAVQSSLVLFTRYSYGWGTSANGWVLAGIGASQAVAEGVLLSSVTARLGERRTALLGYVAGALGYMVLVLALAGWTVVPAVVLLALGGLAVPSVRAMVSARGEVDTQGGHAGRADRGEGADRRGGAAADGLAVLRLHLAGPAGALRRRAVRAGGRGRGDVAAVLLWRL